MSRKERGFKMGIGKAGSMLAPVLFVLNSLWPWLERLAKLPMGVEGGLRILLAWTLVNATMAE